MSYLDIDIQRSYRSCGDSNIANAFITPALKCTKVYRRSVGYFSSNVFLTILDGVVALARNNGSVQLIASPKLSSEDIEAINHGYAERDKIIRDSFQRDFLKEIESLDDMRLALLSELISRGILDIRIAVTDTIGDYHDKLGIMQDFDGNSLVFYGSANATMNGYKNNYEKIRVVRSWIPGEVERERLNWQRKALATDVLPFWLLRNTLACIEPQIQSEKDYIAYHALKTKLDDSQFTTAIQSVLSDNGITSEFGDVSVQLANRLRKLLLDKDWSDFSVLFGLSAEDERQVLSVIERVCLITIR